MAGQVSGSHVMIMWPRGVISYAIHVTITHILWLHLFMYCIYQYYTCKFYIRLDRPNSDPSLQRGEVCICLFCFLFQIWVLCIYTTCDSSIRFPFSTPLVFFILPSHFEVSFDCLPFHFPPLPPPSSLSSSPPPLPSTLHSKTSEDALRFCLSEVEEFVFLLIAIFCEPLTCTLYHTYAHHLYFHHKSATLTLLFITFKDSVHPSELLL